MIMVYCPIPSIRWTVHDQKFVRSSILSLLSWSSVRIRPWGGRSVVKNRSIRPPYYYKLGPASESVHMDGWTVRRRPSSSVEACWQWHCVRWKTFHESVPLEVLNCCLHSGQGNFDFELWIRALCLCKCFWVRYFFKQISHSTSFVLICVRTCSL